MLTVNKVKKRVDAIRELLGDSANAHYEEDRLYEEVLEAIAIGNCDDPAECANQAIETKKIGFSRWYE